MSHICPFCGYGCRSFSEQHNHKCEPEAKMTGLLAWLPKSPEEINVRDVTFLDEIYFWPRPIKWNKEKKK